MKALTLLQREPVRVYLYGVLTTIVAALAATGVITGVLVPVYLAVGGAILAVPAVEAARDKVVPVAKIARVEVTDGLGPHAGDGLTDRAPEELDEDERAAVEAVENDSV